MKQPQRIRKHHPSDVYNLENNYPHKQCVARITCDCLRVCSSYSIYIPHLEEQPQDKKPCQYQAPSCEIRSQNKLTYIYIPQTCLNVNCTSISSIVPTIIDKVNSSLAL